MTNMNKEWLKQWLQKANHDLIASKMILDSHPIILDISCFHCQQAIEKLLKLFLLANNQELIKTHSLDILVEECIDIDKSFSELDFKDLESYTQLEAGTPINLSLLNHQKSKNITKLL